MQKEAQFFTALTINRAFRQGVLNSETREKTIKAGYLGVDFGLNALDKEIMNSMGSYETAREFAQEYMRLSAEKRKTPYRP